MVNPIRAGMIVVCIFMGVSLCGMPAGAQGIIYKMVLPIVPPDSVYLKQIGSNILIGWYPPGDGRGQMTGSRDFTYWYCMNDTVNISRVGIFGQYPGGIDRTLIVNRFLQGNLTPVTVGSTPSIRMLAEVDDTKNVYSQYFNIGSDYYVPGDLIPLYLVNQAAPFDTLQTGLSLSFGPGLVDTACGLPTFTVDLQALEGFHIWRGLSPYPSRMEVIEELSRLNAFMGLPKDSLYFLEWPKKDSRGRLYYEYVDRNVFAGFTYYYNVSCFDKGYYLGKIQHNKQDNFICDENPADPLNPGHPVYCDSVALRHTMTVSPQSDPKRIFAVPNPYRTGTSTETTPYYHNFPDGGIKFFNVPVGSDIKIFTIAGDLIWETRHSDPTGTDGIVTWPVKNKHGAEVGSGAYIYRVESPAGSMYGRIVIIR